MDSGLTQYWFYLEPYVFLFKGKGHVLVYNSLNGFYLKCEEDILLDHVLLKLLEPDSGYCIRLDSGLLGNETVKLFVAQIRNSFSGDLADCKSVGVRPFIFKPKLKVLPEASLKHLKEDDVFSGRNIMKNLNEVTLFLNSSCDRNCRSCSGYSRQFDCCLNSGRGEMPWERCFNLLLDIENSGVRKVNFSGGNLLAYTHWRQLLSGVEKFSFKKKLYIHIENLEPLLERFDAFDVLLPDVRVIIPVWNLEACSDECAGMIKSYKMDMDFVVSSENDVACLNFFVDRFGIDSSKVHLNLFYDGHNKSFFEKNVYTSLSDITDYVVDKNSIFRRQTLNEYFYGKLIILPDGDTYANLNHPCIGNVFLQSLKQMVYAEMKQGKSWFYTRDRGKCKGCSNKYLCPSPSNYELVMRKMDLCSIL